VSTIRYAEQQILEVRVKENKLLPCPFCGGIPVLINEEFVYCNNYKCAIGDNLIRVDEWKIRAPHQELSVEPLVAPDLARSCYTCGFVPCATKEGSKSFSCADYIAKQVNS